MKFYEQMYVGFKRSRYMNSEEPRVLGFAVPANNKKRRETVDGWSDKDVAPRTIDNVPTRGFKLVDVVSRYSTSNKFFRVLDPRGFELEIPTDNLLDLCLNSTIVNGEFIDEYVWATDTKNYLIPASDPQYILWKSTVGKPATKVESGEYYVSPKNLSSVFRL